jgi:NADH dehydrogenase FAD-containing subunit
MRQIDPSRHDVTVVSRRNHFVYTPLPPSTVVGTVEFRTIVEPRVLLSSLDVTGNEVRSE